MSSDPITDDSGFKRLYDAIDTDKSDHVSAEELCAEMQKDDSELRLLLQKSAVNATNLLESILKKNSDKLSFKEFRYMLSEHAVDTKVHVERWIDEVLKILSNPKYVKEESGAVLPPPTPANREAAIKSFQEVMDEMLLELGNDMRKNKPEFVVAFDESTQVVLKSMGIPTELNGNSRGWWGTKGGIGLYPLAKKATERIGKIFSYTLTKRQKKVSTYTSLGYMVRVNYELRHDDNVGAIVLKDCTPPRILFRSGTMVNLTDKNSMLNQLITKADLKHITNLYAGHFPLHDVYEEEKRLILEAGGTYHNEATVSPPRKWRDLIKDEEVYEKNLAKASGYVAGVIKDVLLPGGKPPIGNMLIHCGGGMHRTGMIYGIIRRCIAEHEKDEIINDYRKHVDWQSEENPGGAEKLNEKFIMEYDEKLIKDVENILEAKVDEAEEFDEWGF